MAKHGEHALLYQLPNKSLMAVDELHCWEDDTARPRNGRRERDDEMRKKQQQRS
jgi:hypothetical protein